MDLEDSSLDFVENNYNEFFDTMNERIRIWKKRNILNQEYPWTDNYFMSRYRFVNVYRELDRSSQYLINRIIKDDTNTDKNLIFKIIIYRLINKPETFEWIENNYGYKAGIQDIEKFDVDEYRKILIELPGSKHSIFQNAYKINTMYKKNEYKYNPRLIFGDSIESVVNNIDLIYDTVKNTNKYNVNCLINLLCDKLISVKEFIATEFYDDFTYIPKYTNRTFVNFNTNDFFNIGPGAELGIRLIFPSVKENEYNDKLISLYEDSKTRVKEFIEYDKNTEKYIITNNFNFEYHQIEFWLCEYWKYWKIVRNPRAKMRLYIK